MKTIGLFFGSFNPIHYGHIMTANFCIENYCLDELLFVVAAHNPFKEKHTIAPFEKRVDMCNLALEGHSKMNVEVIEHTLTEPFYTYKTIEALKKKYLDTNFVLIIGIDNWLEFDKWANYQSLLSERIIVLPRGNNEDLTSFIKKKNKIQDLNYSKRIEIFENSRFASKCPNCNLSASFIRNEILNKRNIFGYTPDKVINYIKENKMYGM